MTLMADHRTRAVGALLPGLERPGDAVAHLSPNWFAAVMGTGIVATAAVSVPRQVPGLHTFAVAVWVLATALLVVLLAATTAHWVLHPRWPGVI